jgi:hypothetical protein
MEIYNEQLYDLLEPYKQHLKTEAQRKDLHKKRARLRIREDSKGCTHICELQRVRVRSDGSKGGPLNLGRHGAADRTRVNTLLPIAVVVFLM